MVQRLLTPARAERLTHLEELPERPAHTGPWPTWVHPEVRAAFEARGVAEPWLHQVEAMTAAHRGEHVVVATGTGSGKSQCYQVPALGAALAARGARGERGASTLYIAPTKALAQDQLAAIQGLGLGVRASTHDGDSSREQREWCRDHAEYLLTNPDMLHLSMLPGHARWRGFWRSLRYVVLDECHHYRGVFGAHVSHVLRRLRRVCAAHGAHPTFVLASATVAEPGDLAERLTGLPHRAVTDDASPRGRVTVALWEPPFVSHGGENGAPVRRAASSETADLMTDLVIDGARTLAFVRSRRGVEAVAAAVSDRLAEVDAALVGRVAPYRGGYLPEERRAIEQRLRSGDLLGIAATNALELGIDVHGLDAVVLAGFPGTRAAMWQQLGRAGRGGADALGVLVARDDPLDTYLVHHPETLLGRPVEACVFDPGNPYVLGPHLCAAAEEQPLERAELEIFGPGAAAGADALAEAGMLRRRGDRYYWTDNRRACDLADIRSTGGAAYSLVDGSTGRVVGTVDAGAAHGTAHQGAVYLHLGETWLVRELDLEQHVAVIERTEVQHSTSAREVIDIRILQEETHTRWGRCRLSFGSVEVSHQVVAFLKRRVPSGEVIGEEPLDLPERTLPTRSVWWTVPTDVLEEAGLAAADLPGAAHAAEHASIGMLPLFATCDRWDIGGVSTALHPDTGELTVFVHDAHPGGAGFSERGYAVAGSWLSATREAIASCQCPSGCPSCIQSPKCGNQNNPLDKDGALRLLEVLLAGRAH
nr:DEAD/DEAH box helicase [Nocardioides daejeonensis]